MSFEIISERGKGFGLRPPSRIKLDMAFGVGAGPELKDKSRYRSHGAIIGPDWADGLHGRCLDFDRAAIDYVLIPAAHTQFDFTSEDFSVVARVRLETLAGSQDLLNRGVTNLDGWFAQLRATRELVVRTNQTPGFQSSHSSVGGILDNTWYTLGFSRSGASIRIYNNGVDDTAIAGVHIDPLTSARALKIGIQDNLLGDNLDGKVEFLRIFGGIALSTSEHLAWHRALA